MSYLSGRGGQNGRRKLFCLPRQQKEFTALTVTSLSTSGGGVERSQPWYRVWPLYRWTIQPMVTMISLVLLTACLGESALIFKLVWQYRMGMARRWNGSYTNIRYGQYWPPLAETRSAPLRKRKRGNKKCFCCQILSTKQLIDILSLLCGVQTIRNQRTIRGR
jgi:hypothetical protein